MNNLTRRRFVQGGIAAGAALTVVPFSQWWAPRAHAATRTRYSAYSTEGKEMLKSYAKAVAAMKAMDDGDPLSWTFQWYTHWVRGDSTKAAEVARIYGDGPSYNKSLAEANWDTCRGHGGFQADWFLPWHRMYVLFLEDIVREMSDDPAFTLPYWPYNEPDKRMIPPEFRMKDDPTFGSLFVEKRNNGINEGESMEAVAGATPLSFSCLAIPTYLPDADHPQGFNGALDRNPHGTVHGNVGDSRNMGSVPWAAGDPIFWLHHCEVDRLWASWNVEHENPSDPAFTSAEFSFADDQGQLIVGKTGDFLATIPLGYDYDTLVPLPPSARTVTLTSGLPTGPAVLFGAGVAPRTTALRGAAADGQAIALGGRPTRVALEPAAGVGVSALAAPNRLRGADDRTYLVIENISAESQPGTGYLVFLNLGEDEEVTPDNPAFVGGINFFDAVRMPGHDMRMADTFVFDITDTLATLAETGRLDRAPDVSLVPTGPVSEGSAPTVESIRIFTQ